MARTKTVTIQPAEPKKRIRRTEDQLIAELQAEIERLKTKAAVKAIKKDPSKKHTASAVRNIDQALATATDQPLRQALDEARTVLVAYLQLEGIKLPQKRGRKPGWRKKADVAVAG
jgi:CHASE3 domain sensor protein